MYAESDSRLLMGHFSNSKIHRNMTQLLINIYSEIAERIELASNTLDIDQGELFSDFLLSYTGKETRRLPGVNAEEIFNSIGDPLDTFKHLLQEIKRELEAAPESESAGFTIQLTENEQHALQFFSRYQGETPDQFVKNLLHIHFEGILEGMETDPENETSFKTWLKDEHNKQLQSA